MGYLKMKRTMTRWLCTAVLLTAGCGDDGENSDNVPENGTGDSDTAADVGTDSEPEIPVDHCADPVGSLDTDGNFVVVAEDALNYSFSSSLEIETVPVRSLSDIRFDWSGITKDMLGHDFDPNTSVDMMELMSWRYTKEDLLVAINDDALDTSFLVALGVIFTDQSMTSGNFLDLNSPSGGEVPDDELLSYVDTTVYSPDETTYFIMVAEGDSFGHGTKMISFFEPDPTETNTEVILNNDSTKLHYTAELTELKRIAVPSATPNIILDWIDSDRLLKNAMGAEWIPTKITDVMVAHYLAKTPEELQEEFLDLDLIADETWDIFLSAGQSVNLKFLKNEAGETFPGIDETGTWIVALKCGGCSNPAPWFLSILQSCPL